MKNRPENLEPAAVLGYLGADDVLYCSPGCAAARGQTRAAPVDPEGYPNLVRRESAGAFGRCPVCGSEFPLDWSP